MKNKRFTISIIVLSILLSIILCGCSFENYIDEEFRADFVSAMQSDEEKKNAQGSNANEGNSQGAQSSENINPDTDKDSENEQGKDVTEQQEEHEQSSEQTEQPKENTIVIPMPEVEFKSGSSAAKLNVGATVGSTQAEYFSAEDSYFNDALFIGDSRTCGLMSYGRIESGYWFCHSGLSTFNYDDSPYTELTADGLSGTGLDGILAENSFGKIYIGLGINECGYKMVSIQKAFHELITKLRNAQPDALIFINANIHVTGSKSTTDKVYNNAKINDINRLMKAYEDGEHIFFVDSNEIFDDENGNLKKANSGDQVHLYGKCYPLWAQFIRDHAVRISDE